MNSSTLLFHLLGVSITTCHVRAIPVVNADGVSRSLSQDIGAATRVLAFTCRHLRSMPCIVVRRIATGTRRQGQPMNLREKERREKKAAMNTSASR